MGMGESGMNLTRVLEELRRELQYLDSAILHLERLQTKSTRRRGRPPKILSELQRPVKPSQTQNSAAPTPARRPLERHVVVGDALVEFFSLRLRGRLRTLLSSAARHGDRTRARRRLIEFAVARRGSAAAEQHQVVANHLGEILLLSLLVVAAGLEASLDVDLFALLQVVGYVLRAPDDAVVPVRLFFPFTRLLIFPAAIGGDGERGRATPLGVNLVSASLPR